MKRRSFLEYALAGGASAGIANLTIMKDLYAQAGGPIVIGHHCELTGGFASWGYWHDKAARKAVDLINKGGGIARRKVELVTEDTEANPASGARKLRNLIERSNAEFVVGSVHSGIMLASIPIASICCSPPDRVPPGWRARSFRRGKRSSTRASICGSGLPGRPTQRFS